MPFLTQGKTNWKYILNIIILAMIVGGGILSYQYWWLPREEAKNSQRTVACTEEAKVCPDGSAVSRTGPNCEFAPCPNTKADETADWKTYRNEEYGFEIKYPPIPDCGFCKLDKADEDGFLVNRTSLTIESLEGLTLSEFVDKEMEMFTIESREEHLIDGREAISVSYRFGGMNRYAQATFIKKDDKVIIVSFSAGGFCCTEGEEIYELELYSDILSTFKFIEEFCGSSTYGNCADDSDCTKDGCSSQVCRSKSEEGIVTTCEWKECYRAQDYGLSCKCVDKKCQWVK